MKPVVLGMLAHVDAGKTTLSEAMLYTSGCLRKLGRVDHGTAFLDFDEQERSRGITIFSKEIILPWKQSEFMILDTPGHVDFSAEMERTLQVLDAAIMVISGVDGIQAHSETIWKLLHHYRIPTFLFINKMDIAHFNKAELLRNIQERFGEHCLDFGKNREDLMEEIAMSEDTLLESYVQTGTLSHSQVQEAIAKRWVFPCYFGSALKLDQIDALLDGLDCFLQEKTYPKEFGARIYKISHDASGMALTHMKITGGTLSAKEVLEDGEKVDQIRRYHGESYQMVPQIAAGYVCAIKGLEINHIQQGLGIEKDAKTKMLASYMRYRMVLPKGVDGFAAMKILRPLALEEPSLHLSYDTRMKEIYVQVRGEVQIEILQKLIETRFHLNVTFDEGSIAYRETIRNPIEGVGHYEPLRHYAEVHLLLEPLPRNSGLQYASTCPLEMLDAATQRMILSYLQNEEQIGVLSGSLLCDMKITLLGGKAHLKHTSGGDFREAARRALRQGLKMAECELLEPQDEFRLEIPNTCMSRVMFDLEAHHAICDSVQEQGEYTILCGKAATAWMINYAQEVRSFSKGKGRLMRWMSGYQKVLHQDAIVQKIGYDSERDLDHPTGSIFCIHGAGTYVKWDEVYAHMHVDLLAPLSKPTNALPKIHRQITIDDAELQRVVAPLHQPRKSWKKPTVNQAKVPVASPSEQVKQKGTCLLVDGYNMIFSWPQLKELAKDHMDTARNRLLAMLSSYQGYQGGLVIVVFDAYRKEASKEQVYKDHNLYVVYTKTSQTADSYIELVTHTLAKNYHVIVATSDGQEQNIILGQGALRLSANQLYQEVSKSHQQGREHDVMQPQFRHMALEALRTMVQEKKDKKE